ncbi:hypothetical protein F0A16_02820 [Salinicola corii]|uniref:Uncharacterized protein n=1 Tax=Salinicola corii TaxID=2606937 RepID=A0A640WJD7_9GAMM|nr:hypothetical protein [Salinicola corii]KAA0020738.1 hypothetical protein F0A16_02820 [Salinicola corii]
MMIDTNPRVAWAAAFETGIRTQAMVSMLEAQTDAHTKKSGRRHTYSDVAMNDRGEEVVLNYTRDQVSASETRSRKGGAGAAHGEDAFPIWQAVKRLEESNPVLAAVGHWLSLNDTGAANEYLDDVADTILVRYQMAIGMDAWNGYRRARRERVEALIKARMMQDRDNVDGSRPPLQPRAICQSIYGLWGIRIISDNWKQDGWDKTWPLLGDIVSQLESEAMEPIMTATRDANREMRNFIARAA